MFVRIIAMLDYNSHRKVENCCEINYLFCLEMFPHIKINSWKFGDSRVFFFIDKKQIY